MTSEPGNPKATGKRWRILSTGGIIGLLGGIVYGSLRNQTALETHGFGAFLGGVCWEAQLGLVCGAIVGAIFSALQSKSQSS